MAERSSKIGNYEPKEDPALIEYCRSRGYPRPDIWAYGVGAFIWHFKENEKPMKNWTRAAQNWIRKAAPDGPFHRTREWEDWMREEKRLQGREAQKTHRELGGNPKPKTQPKWDGLTPEQRQRGQDHLRPLKDLLTGVA